MLYVFSVFSDDSKCVEQAVLSESTAFILFFHGRSEPLFQPATTLSLWCPFGLSFLTCPVYLQPLEKLLMTFPKRYCISAKSSRKIVFRLVLKTSKTVAAKMVEINTIIIIIGFFETSIFSCVCRQR